MILDILHDLAWYMLGVSVGWWMWGRRRKRVDAFLDEISAIKQEAERLVSQKNTP